MTETLAFAPVLPWSALALLAALVLGACIVLAIRRRRGAIVRALAGFIVLAALTGPRLVSGEREVLPDIAVLITDESGSQQLGERADRTRAVADDLERRLRASENVELRRLATDGGGDSRLLAAAETALADVPRARRAAVFFVTDGRALDIEEDASPEALAGPAERIGAPVHVFDTQSDEPDRRIAIKGAPRYGVVGDSIPLVFSVEVTGEPAAPVAVEARIDGESVGRGLFVPGEEARFEVPVRRAGPLVIELAVEEGEEELTLRNNAVVIESRGVRDRLRVLLISGEPHPGQRSWRNLLKSDPSVDLVNFTILRPLEKIDGTPQDELALIEFPTRELFIEKLQEFDLIVFDRYTYRNVLLSIYFDNIARYVEAGGALLIASGPEFAGRASLAGRRNLAFVLPAAPSGDVIETPYRPERTDVGRRHPITAALPPEESWGRWARAIGVSSVGGETLLDGPNGAPILVVDRVGQGRVALLLSDHVWLWARGFDGGGPYTEFMRRMAHWLMGEPDLEEEALRARVEGDALLLERRTLSDAPPTAEITLPDDETVEATFTEVEPGLYRARTPAAENGVYRARSGELYAVAAKGAAEAAEFAAPVGENLLARLAEASGGGVYSYDATPAIRRVSDRGAFAGGDWAGVIRRGAEEIGPVVERPLLPAPLVVAIVLSALALSWAVEGGRLFRRR